MSIILLLFGLAAAWLSTTQWVWKRPIVRGLVWFFSIISVLVSDTQLFPWFLFDIGSVRTTLVVFSSLLLPSLIVFIGGILKYRP